MKRGPDSLTNHLKESEFSEERNTRRGPAGGNTPGSGPRPLAVVLRALGDADVTPTDVQL